MSEESKRLGADEICPCGSGLSYLDCCSDSGSGKWFKSSSGDLFQKIQLDGDMIVHVENYLKMLEEKLGRPLTPDDKLFPDMTPELMRDLVLEQFLDMDTDLDPLIFYIFLEEELLITSKNIDLISTGDRLRIIKVVMRYSTSEDRGSLLASYKDQLKSEIYHKLYVMISTDDRKEEEILGMYIDLLGNDAVALALRNRQVSEDSPSIIIPEVSPENVSIYDYILTFIQQNMPSDIITYYLSEPLKGKHYYIGGLSELLEITDPFSPDVIRDMYLQRKKLPSDSFTLHFFFDMDTETGLVVDPSEHKEFVIAVDKVCDDFAFVSGWLGGYHRGIPMAMYPIIGILPLSDTDLSKEDVIENVLKSIDKDFSGLEMHNLVFTSDGTLNFLVFGGTDEDICDTFKAQILDLLFRFLDVHDKGEEVKVSPNSDIKSEGYLPLPSYSKDYYLISMLNKFIGYMRDRPES